MRRCLLVLPWLLLALGCCKDTAELEAKIKTLEQQKTALEAQVSAQQTGKKGLAEKIIGDWGAVNSDQSIRGLTITPNGMAHLSLPGKAIIQGTYLLAGNSFQLTGNNLPDPGGIHRFDIISVTDTELLIRKDGDAVEQKLKRV